MKEKGRLYIVGTPIGNLEDISFRAVRVLKEVGAIAAEDTRHTGKLLKHFGINTPQVSYHQHNEKQRLEELLGRLEGGEDLALVTDAGMPGISDPGYDLVRGCVEHNIQVVPIPGPTAVITALGASGLKSDRFVFEGFLPTQGKERVERLELLARETRTVILYEAPHRLIKTLEALQGVLGGDRGLVIARELTKLHEEFWRGTFEEAQLFFQTHAPRGEYTLVIAGKEAEKELMLSEEEVKQELMKLLEGGMTRSQASRYLAQFSNLSRREIYQLLPSDATLG